MTRGREKRGKCRRKRKKGRKEERKKGERKREKKGSKRVNKMQMEELRQKKAQFESKNSVL
jgi:hypothetical protein